MPGSSGYSGTPLTRKLGIRSGTVVCALEQPAEYRELLAPLPEGVQFKRAVSTEVDVIHVFATELAALDTRLRAFRAAIRPDAAVWVSWPKRTSKVATDITEDRIRQVALPMGFVDIKVCAVSEVWSGLKLVVRKELRPRTLGP